MEREAANARFDRLHPEGRQFHDGTRTSWAAKPSDDHPYHYRAGVSIWVSDEDHGFGGDFLRTHDPDDEVGDEPDPST